MESIFTRLHSYRPRENKNSEEDFFTEAFAGVLEQYPELFKHALTELINDRKAKKYDFSDCELTVETQCSFDSLNAIKGQDRPDMVIRGRKDGKLDIVIMVENKIGSPEGDNQLNRYANQLSERFVCHNKYLLYITKYSEPKNADEIMNGIELNARPSFIQSAWHEIYDILRSFHKGSDKELLQALLKFMEDKGMILKLGFGDLMNTVKHKQIEDNYKKILERAWDESKLSAITDKGSSRSTWNGPEQLSHWTANFSPNKYLIYYGFWYGNKNSSSAFTKAFNNASNDLPRLFVAIATDTWQTDLVKELANLDSIKLILKDEWKVADEGLKEWVLLAKAINLTDIQKADNLANYFVDKFMEEFDKLEDAIRTLKAT